MASGVTLSDCIALGGVIVNFLVVLVAIVVPAWQRRALLSDARKAEKRSWKRFTEAFKELAAAQDAVVAAASVGDSTETAKAFAAAETELRSAMDAFTASLATSLPVRAAINASRAEQIAAETLAQLPDLKPYGSNILTYDTVKTKMKEACEKTHLL